MSEPFFRISTHQLTFDQLRRANLERIPLFKNGKGEIAHPTAYNHVGCGLGRNQPLGGPCLHVEPRCTALPVGADWSLGDWITAVTGELGEFANIAKKVRRGDLSMDEARASMAKELADVACYLDILALQCDVNLGDAIVAKFNEVSDRIGVSTKLGQ